MPEAEIAELSSRMSTEPKGKTGCTRRRARVPDAIGAGHILDEHQSRHCWVGVLPRPPHGERGFAQASMQCVLMKARLAGTHQQSRTAYPLLALFRSPASACPKGGSACVGTQDRELDCLGVMASEEEHSQLSGLPEKWEN